MVCWARLRRLGIVFRPHSRDNLLGTVLYPLSLGRSDYARCCGSGARRRHFSLMKRTGSVLPADAVLLSTHRSVALAPREVVPMDWATYVNSNTTEPLRSL